MLKSKKLLIISLLLICIFGIGMVSASDVSNASVSASDEGVSTSNVDVTSSSDSATLINNWADLKTNCENETGSQDIKLNSNLAPESQILIKHNVVITGSANTYIGGSDENNIATYSYIPFYTTASNVNITLKDIRFQNCGGNILMQFSGNGNYILDNCTFYNVNATNAHQSVVYLNLGEGIIENCNFTKCTTSFGTVTNHNAASTTNVHMIVRNCNFEDNYASTEPGAINNCGQLEVYNSNFTGNGAYWWAGAIHTHYNANTTIVGSIFRNNVAGWNGGALYTYSTLSIFNSTFIGNNCTTNNGGGAIGAYNYGSNFDILIDNCYFADNNNTCEGNGRGGAISTLGAGKLQIYNTDFENNDAAIGRTIAVYGSSSTTFIYHNGRVVDPKDENNDTIVINGNVNASVVNVTVVPYINETGNETNDTNGSSSEDSPAIIPEDTDINTPNWNVTLSDKLAGSPVIDADGNIYVPNGQYIYCYSSDGTLKWNFTTQWGYFHELAIYNNLLFAPASWDTLYILNLNNGTLVENFTNNYQASSYFAPVFGNDGTIYVSSEYGYGDGENLWIAMVKYGNTTSATNTYYYAGSICQIDNVTYGNQALLSAPVLDGEGNIWVNTIYGLMCVNLSNGQTVVSNITGVIGAPVVGSNGVIYYLGNDSKVYARNTTGELWSVDINGTSGTTLIIDDENSTLYTVSAEGYIYKIDISTHNSQKWYKDRINPVSSAIAMVDDVLYVGDDQGIVWAIIDDESSVIWVFNASSAIVGGFAIKNNTIYAGNSNGTFYALPIEITFQSLDVQSLLNNNVVRDVLSASSQSVLGIDYKDIYVSTNGTGDGSSRDNPTTLQNAAASLTDNTIIHFADGIYTLTSTMEFSKTNITMLADNYGKAVITPSKVRVYFRVKDANNVVVKGLAFTGSYMPFFSINKVNNVTVDSCFFENSTKVKGSANCVVLARECNLLKINNCSFKNCVKAMVECYDIVDGYITNCIFQNMTDNSYNSAYATNLIRIANNINKVENFRSTTIENCTFINNTVTIVNEVNSLIVLNSGTIRNCVFQNNSCQYDAYVTDMNWGDNNAFYYLENNVFEHPIKITAGNIFSATDLVILDNKTVDCNVGDIVNITATLRLSDSPIADIYPSSFKFIINGVEYDANYTNGIYYYEYAVTKADLVSVSAVCSNMESLQVYDANLYARLASNISLENVSSINYGDNVTLVANLPSEVSGNVTFIVNDKNYTTEINDAVAKVTINDLDAGDYTVYAKYLGDLTYSTSVSSTVSFNVSKVNSTMNINVKDINFGEIAIITANLPATSTGNVTFMLNNKPYVINVTDGVAKLELSNLTSGPYDIVANYTGDNNYNSCGNTTSFKVNKLLPNLAIIVSDVEIAEDVIITVTAPNDAKYSINFEVNGEIESVSLENGTASYTLSKVKAGEYNITVTYAGDDKYVSNSNFTSFVVNKFNSTLSINVSNIHVGDKEIITIVVPSNATGIVDIIVNDKKETLNLTGGVASLTLEDLVADTYNVTVSYSGDDKYSSNSSSTSFNVSKIDNYQMIVATQGIIAGENGTIYVSLPAGASGTITIKINNKTYVANVTKDVTEIAIDPLEKGEVAISTTYSGDNKYVSKVENGNITVVQNTKVNLDVENITMIFKDGTRLIAKLTDYKGNAIANATIYFVINNITYNRTTDVNGSASMALNLNAGTYSTSVLFNGTKDYDKISKDISVIIKSTIDGQNIVKMYQNDTQFYATFVDSTGKALANTNVTFNINGVFYNRTTDVNGQAKLSINLRPGNYTLTAINPFNSEEKGFNVLVKSLIEAGDLTKYYQNASKFEAKIYNKDGSLAINKEVQFNINGVFYKRTTDANGVVSFAINLRPGEYDITTVYDGLSVGNKVTVLSTLETKDLSMKFQDGSKFQAKALNGQGSPIANQEITFNVNGVFYHRTTGSDGVANLNINLNKGEYIITSMWNEYQTGNKITIA